MNNGKSMDFMPEMSIDGYELEVVEEMRVLGITIRADMKRSSNTDHIVVKAYKRLWILR